MTKNTLILESASDFLTRTTEAKLRETSAETKRFLATLHRIDDIPDSMRALREELREKEISRHEAEQKRIHESYEKSFTIGTHMLRVGHGETTRTYYEEQRARYAERIER